MDVLKKAAKSRRNARLNPYAEEEVEAAGDPGASRDERAIARPEPTVYEEKPIQIIFIKASDAEPGQARQLPWVVRGPATPSTNWLAVLGRYALRELGEAAHCYCEEGEHHRLFIGILRDIQGQNVTPDAADQIELINDDQINAWLRFSRCTTLTVAYFLHRPAVVPPGGGDPVRPNTPLVGHYRKYLVPSQFDVAEVYTEAESSPDEEDPENIAGRPKRRKAFPRSDRGWQKRIRSNDRKVIRFQNQSRALIFRAQLQQGERYMRRYAGLAIPTVALPPGIPPPGCEAPLDDADMESNDSDSSSSSDDDN